MGGVSDQTVKRLHAGEIDTETCQWNDPPQLIIRTIASGKTYEQEQSRVLLMHDMAVGRAMRISLSAGERFEIVRNSGKYTNAYLARLDIYAVQTILQNKADPYHQPDRTMEGTKNVILTGEQATRAMANIHTVLDEIGVPDEHRLHITVSAPLGGDIHIRCSDMEATNV